MKDFSLTSARESIEFQETDVVTEVRTQTGWGDIAFLFFFKRRYNFHARSKYTWKKTSDGWRITTIVVLEETGSRASNK